MTINCGVCGIKNNQPQTHMILNGTADSLRRHLDYQWHGFGD